MNAKKWRSTIVRNLKKVNIDAKQYDSMIKTLADILEQRDVCFEQYVEDGGMPVIEYTNKAGATNMVKHPMLVTWIDLNTQALAYWRELGLTPSSYKKMTGATKSEEKGSALVEALKAIEAAP